MHSKINLKGKIALVTGANQGIGFELCRQLANLGCEVILTSRNITKGTSSVKKLREENIDVIYHSLDIADFKSVVQIYNYISDEFHRLDILINNAGIYIDSEYIDNISSNKIIETLTTNAFGPLYTCQQFIPLMQKNNFGRVVNISSGMGVIQAMNYDGPAYRISKATLNAITVMFSKRNSNKNVLINAVCPGPVRTNMSSPKINKTPSDVCPFIIDVCRLPNGSFSGYLFKDSEIINW